MMLLENAMHASNRTEHTPTATARIGSLTVLFLLVVW